MMGRVEGKLEPSQILAPPRMILMMISNKVSMKVPVEALGMRRLGVVGGGRNMPHTSREAEVAKVTGSKLGHVI
jgi:hypothetical protein